MKKEKTVKRITAFILAFTLLLTGFCVPSTAAKRIKAPESIEDLRDGFVKTKGPKVGAGRMDYAYFTPVKGGSDKTKYPLVIFCHGLFHGVFKNQQLNTSDMPYWTSKKLQSRFRADGAFVMLPRSATPTFNGQLKLLKAAIDDFIAKNKKNIDTTKIIILGSSAGGGMARKMLVAYPELFDGAVLACQTGELTEEDAKVIRNIPVWIIATKNDILTFYNGTQLPAWNRIRRNTKVLNKCRLTTFTSVTYPNGSKPLLQHKLAKMLTYDLDQLNGEPLKNMQTLDGNLHIVNVGRGKGIINWINTL